MYSLRSVFFKLVACLSLFLLLIIQAEGQVRTPPGWYHEPKPHSRLRYLLSKVHLEVTPGLTKTYYRHDLEGLALYQGLEGTRVFQPADYSAGTNSISSSLTKWFQVSESQGAFTVNSGDRIYSSDTVGLVMKHQSRGFPFSVSLFVKIDRFKIGGGYWIQPEVIREFQLQKFPAPDILYDPDVGFIFLRKYYGLLGGDIIRFGDWVMSADLRVGGWNPGKKFNLAQIDKGMFFNLGAGFEWDIAEYFRIYLRPSFELRKFTLNIPETSGSISHRANNRTIQVGAIVRLPEKPKCKIKQCQVQIDHLHGDREYRSRMFPIWKRQNPNYGQNYPRLIKYKRLNRKKKNPY